MESLKALQTFGLSEKEAKVYLASLELGTATASDISIKSNLPRTLVYDLLERLIELGLVTYVIKNHKKYFSAVNPKELSEILEEKQNIIKEALPNLESLYKSPGIKRPLVEVYEGKEGLKTLMNDLLKLGIKELLAYGSSRSFFEVDPFFIEHWHKERILKKIKIRVMYNETEQTKERLKKHKESLGLTKYKFLPIKVESPTPTLIYENKLVFLHLVKKEPFAVLIDNEQMANNYRKYFEELWKIAK
ncbi:MAG: TrmB family transcriptional regulator [Candidatus Thorarchaeota archaeon]